MAQFELEAIVSRVSTLADGGIRVSFDLDENAIEQAAYLMEMKRRGKILRVVINAEGE